MIPIIRQGEIDITSRILSILYNKPNLYHERSNQIYSLYKPSMSILVQIYILRLPSTAS